ncbi:ATP-binding protein [Alysiella filiformis]|uniref:Chemotaxis protein CheA n=1 Tax=Alysiella filiformis DSM 16848 TaxID=1120981 RepID=A0A286E5Z4_9NEIS|nr:ATP-binding protein [Alysiella filiformis]QMT32380.1 chemotaxis protein CheA [Alysiella filiformis]UBQ56699.1 chemotaxis protein CheA [Alysiella filiformis DSM 16848]SOD66291.1 Histidine kinase-, DNA gyrase B-, and HSP90-like ATPase [Alysiella filiformis DSM 16848]
MATTKTPEIKSQSTFARYRGLILSVTVFLVLIAALMAVSLNLSSQIGRNNQELTAVSELHHASHNMMQNLFNLKLSYGEDPNSPHIAHSLQMLRDASTIMTTNIEALRKGGVAKTENGDSIEVGSLTQDGNAERMENLSKTWGSLAGQIENYLKEATSPTANSSNLDLAVMNAQNSHDKMNEDIETTIDVLNGKIVSRTNTLGWVQGLGIAGAVIYFVIFVFVFLRQLLASDAKADAARNETDEIMNTVSTGLFLLDKDLNIGSQYSKELEKLLGQRQLGGRNLVEVLGAMISQEDLNTTHSFIGQLYNPRVKERLIGSLNPLTRQAMMVPEGNTNVLRYLDFKFNRVYHGNDISRVLVNVSDVTDAVLLEKKIEDEREQNDMQLEMLSTILRSDRVMIDDFVRNTQRRNMAINNVLKAPGERQNELRTKAEHVFREVHSLKGEASALSLYGFTVIAENIESELKKIQANATLSGENFLGLAVHLEELMNLTQTIEDLVSRLGSGGNVSEGNQASAARPHIADYYKRFVGEVAERNKKIVDFSYVGVSEISNETIRTTINEVAVQLLRNAVVHGIELPEERQKNRKLEAGHVRMEVLESPEQFVLNLEDDGHGIDYEAIRAKAVRLGKYTEAQAAELGTKELLALMFSSGFSTLEQSTGDAGRGVGLDVIKDRVNAIGGKINISTSLGSYTRFTFTFPKNVA